MKIKLIFTVLLLSFMGGFTYIAFGHGDDSTLLEDVNSDGEVNILDLVLVANAFGQSGDRTSAQNPDVNRDGVVNVLDLVRVANRFGETEQEDNSTYHEIQDNIFDKSCVNSACHAPPSNSADLNLIYGQSYQDLINRVPRNTAAADAGMKLIDPGNPDNSFLLTKLLGPENPNFGGRMPFGGGSLHKGKIDAIRTWIAAGAPQEGKIAGIGDLGVLRDPEEVFNPPPPPPPGEGYQIHLPPFKIEPGTEREVFYATQIKDENGQPVEGDIFINRVEIFYPSGSHHFIVYRLTEEGIANGIHKIGVDSNIGVNPEHEFRDLDPDDPQTLGNFGIDRLFVVGTQTDDTVFEFPEGVGLRLPGNTVYDLNSHYINLLGDETLIGETYVNIYTIPEEEVKYEAVEIFVSNRSINVPPGTTRVSTLTWYVEDELERRGHDADTELFVFLLTSHMHRHGELFEIFQNSSGELLHRSIAYDDAPITLYDPVLVLDVGDGLKFQCTHNNYDINEPLQFGLTSEDEMCIIFGYYFIPVEKAGDIIE
ncbi:MAG: dockerin type I domain-containing protein [Candidatus Poribacteria bacterium]|nr:dockerin type I domain-containing protein [Candidatus Poribacteria bacterium]